MTTYTYYYRLRPPGIGCQPSEGLVSIQGTQDGRKSLAIEGEYFWGSAEYSRILSDEEMNRFDLTNELEITWNQFKADKQKMNHIIGKLKTSCQFNKQDDRYCIVHPATQEKYTGQWQISFFDAKGPSGHAVANDKKGIVEELFAYSWKPSEFTCYDEQVS